VNLTDSDSRNVKTPRGWVQGYNAQAAANEQQIVIAAEVTVDSPDFGHLEPMVKAAATELEAIAITQTPGVVLTDAGSWHQQQMEQIVARALRVLVLPAAGEQEGARPAGTAASMPGSTACWPPITARALRENARR